MPGAVTQALIARLQTVLDGDIDPGESAHVEKLIGRLRQCRHRSRCRTRFCPPCARKLAIRDRRRLEDALMRAGGTLVLTTLTVASQTLAAGFTNLIRNLGRLRRQGSWKRVVAGGWQSVHLSPSSGLRRWNVHAHLVVELRGGNAVDDLSLEAPWADLLAVDGLRGSADVRPIEALWKSFDETRAAGSSHRSRNTSHGKADANG